MGTGEGIGASVGQNTGVLVSLGVGVQVGGHVGCGVQVGVGGSVAAGWGVDACVSRDDLSSEITMYTPKPRTHTTARPKTASIAICCLVMVHLRKGNTISTFPIHHYTTLSPSFQYLSHLFNQTAHLSRRKVMEITRAQSLAEDFVFLRGEVNDAV